jgi:hypothetical protein
VVTPGLLILCMFGSKQIEPEPVIHATVDAMTLALTTDQAELEPFRYAERLVAIDYPRLNRAKT